MSQYSSRSIVRIVRFSPLLSVIVRMHAQLHAALGTAPAASRAYLRPLALRLSSGCCRTGERLLLIPPDHKKNRRKAVFYFHKAVTVSTTWSQLHLITLKRSQHHTGDNFTPITLAQIGGTRPGTDAYHPQPEFVSGRIFRKIVL